MDTFIILFLNAVLLSLPDTDALMNATEGFEDHHPGVLYKVIQTGHQEEIVHQHRLAVPQLLLGPVKIKVDREVLNEGGDGVLVGVRLLLDHLDQILHHVAPRGLVRDDRGGQVAQYPGTGGLDGVKILLLVEEQLDN